MSQTICGAKRAIEVMAVVLGGLIGDDDSMEDLDGFVRAGSFRSGNETSIRPAGMSLERALEIAIAVLERKTSKADWFAAEDPYKMPRLF